MAKRQIPLQVKLPPTELIIKKSDFKIGLEQRISIGNDILEFKISSNDDFEQNQKDYYEWNDYNLEYLKQSFNNENNEYKRTYDNAGSLGAVFFFKGRPETFQEKQSDFKKKVEDKTGNLKKLIGKIDLLKSSIETERPSQLENKETMLASDNIFIVHGHEVSTKLDLARTIEKLGLNPIILHEQPNGGKTVIEKFEYNSTDVGFAVVILTCDDIAKPKGSSVDNFRARQNVVFEMGYFIGKLGRNKVVLLYEKDIELPSDINGLVYVPLDEHGHWKFSLIKELKVAGYSVDANALLV